MGSAHGGSTWLWVASRKPAAAPPSAASLPPSIKLQWAVCLPDGNALRVRRQLLLKIHWVLFYLFIFFQCLLGSLLSPKEATKLPPVTQFQLSLIKRNSDWVTEVSPFWWLVAGGGRPGAGSPQEAQSLWAMPALPVPPRGTHTALHNRFSV